MTRTRIAGLVLPGLLLALFVLTPGIARAQISSREGIALENQILELKNELQRLQAQGGGGGTSLGGYQAPAPAQAGPAAGGLTATLLDRVTRLEDQVRQLNGRVDELDHRQQNQNAQLQKDIGDLKFQMNPQGGAGLGGLAPNGALGAQPPAIPGGQPQVGPQPRSLGTVPAASSVPPLGPHPTPEVALHDGQAAMSARDYRAAEAAAREVISNNSTSPRAYDAQFLLAQALAAQGKWQQAALAYDDVYTRSRNGSHAPDALLGLAQSLTAINQKRAACDTLASLRGQFPTPPQRMAGSIASVRAQAGCP